jgi:hypothetical protein
VRGPLRELPPAADRDPGRLVPSSSTSGERDVTLDPPPNLFVSRSDTWHTSSPARARPVLECLRAHLSGSTCVRASTARCSRYRRGATLARLPRCYGRVVGIYAVLRQWARVAGSGNGGRDSPLCSNAAGDGRYGLSPGDAGQIRLGRGCGGGAPCVKQTNAGRRTDSERSVGLPRRGRVHSQEGAAETARGGIGRKPRLRRPGPRADGLAAKEETRQAA